MRSLNATLRRASCIATGRYNEVRTIFRSTCPVFFSADRAPSLLRALWMRFFMGQAGLPYFAGNQSRGCWAIMGGGLLMGKTNKVVVLRLCNTVM
jgi:hypothetical protein